MIEIKNIRFAYGRRQAPVFEDFSLSLAPGRMKILPVIRRK